MLTVKIFEKETGISEVHKIEEFPCKIGRSKTNDIIVNFDSVSEKHCEIIAIEDGFKIRDLGSTNKLVCNDEKKEQHEIVDGDEIYIGDILLTLHIECEDHGKTRVVTFEPKKKTTLLQRFVTNREANIDNLYMFILFAVLLIHEWLFTYNFGMKSFLKYFSFVYVMFLVFFIVLGITSRLVNGKFHWRLLYRTGLVILSVSITLYYISLTITGVLSGGIYLMVATALLIGWLHMYKFGTIIFNNYKRSVVAISSVIVLGLFSVGGLSMKLLDEKDRYNLSGKISYPFISYSKEKRNLNTAWKGITENIKKVNREREELIKEQNINFKKL